MSIINGDILDPGLKFLQLKNYQFTSTNTTASGQCLTIDLNNGVIFACCQNTLVFVPINSLLNFDNWTKELLKTVDTQLAGKVTVQTDPDTVNSHLVSVSSKGYGSKLALCCYDRNHASLFIKFYDLNSLYSNRERSGFYNKFNIPITGQNEIQVRMLLWHPEMSDNVFACCLTNGSFYVVYVSDSDRNVLTVLAQYHTDRHVTSFAWSPKGKQIVLGFQNSTVAHFSQFKLPINEKNLVQNTPFEEVKKINLPEFAGYHVCNICWLSTFNFIIICINPEENDTRYMLVSIPSAKATGDDAIMKIVDFSCINIDSVDESPLEVNFLHLENIIFTYTNRSSGFALLGCSNVNEIAAYNKWFEITLDDDANLTLPVISNDSFVSIRGLTFAPGTAKQFRFSSSIMKGGPNRHFAIAYNGLGQLTLFLSDFENETNAAFLRMHSAPSTLIKPVVSAIPNQPPIANSSIFNPPPPQGATFPPSQSTSFISNQPPVSSVPINFPAQQATIKPTLPKKSVSFNEKVEVSQIKPETSVPESNDSIARPADVSIQAPAQAVVPTPTVESNIDQLYLEEIKSNIDEFNKELKANISAQRKILSSVSIGTNEQFEEVKYEFDFISRILDNISDQFTTLNVDVNDLQTSFIELHYLCEETRSLLDRNTDPKYRNILRQRNLDPITSRKVKEIYSLRDYIDVQLRELNNKFDLEWQEWLQKKRRSNGNFSPLHTKSRLERSAPTAPHSNFMTDEPLNGNSNDDAQYPSQVIYKTLSNNQRLIESLKIKIKELTLSSKATEGSSLKEPRHAENVQNLSKLFNQTLNLNNSNAKKQQKQTIVIQCLSPKQKNSLKNFLENRPSVPIRVCGPCMPGDQYSNKSRFVSVLEKIKQKEQKSPINHLSDLLQPPSDKTPLVTKSEPNKTSIATVSSSTPAVPTLLQKAANQTIAKSTANIAPSSSLSISTKSVVPIPKPQVKVESLPQVVYEDISPADSPTEEKSTKSFGLPLSNISVAKTPTTVPISATSTLSSLLSAASSQNDSKPLPIAAISTTSTAAANIPTFTFSLRSSTSNSTSAPTAKPPLLPQLSKSTTSSPFGAAAPLNLTTDSKIATTVASTASTLSSFSMPSFSASLFGANTSQKSDISILPQSASKPALSFLATNSTTLNTTTSFLVSSANTATVATTTGTSSFFKSTPTVTQPAKPNSNSVQSSGSTLKALLDDSSTDVPLLGTEKISTPAFAAPNQTITGSLLATNKPPVISTQSSGFSFSSALSSLPNKSVGSTGPSNVTSLSTAQPTTNLFTNPAGSFSFGQSGTTLMASAPSSFSFNKALSSASETKSTFSFFSPQSSAAAVQAASVTPSQPATCIAPTLATEATKTSPFTLSQSITSPVVSATSQPAPFSVAQPLTSSVAPTNKTSTFPFGQTPAEAKPSSFTFSSPAQSSAIENSLGGFSICSPTDAPKAAAPVGNAFGSFSFGGNTAVATTASPFGSNSAATSGGDSIFASSVLNSSWSNSAQPSIANQSQGLFSSPANKTGSFGFQTSPPPTGAAIGFGASAKFNSNPAFGGQSPVLGSTQTFGGPPTFGSTATFGSGSPFSSPGGVASGFGVGGQAPFSNFNANETFGNFALKESDVPSFGAFAAETNQFNQFSGPSFGADPSFMQRRK